MSYNDSHLDALDAVAATVADRLTARGTVKDRETTGNGTRVQVLFDDADTPQWIQSAGNVEILGDDRVICVKADGIWTAIATLARRGPSADTYRVLSFTPGNTTSATYVDMPGSPSFVFTKRYDNSHIRLQLTLSGFTNTGSTGARYGVTLTGENGTTGYDIAKFFYNTGVEHHSVAGSAEIAQGHPAGEYVVTLRFRRETGTAQVHVDSNDWASVDIEERF